MSEARWTCLSSHGLVLIALGDDPEIRIRDIAARVGLTERAVQRILNDLTDAGLIDRRRNGRRNHYRVRRERPFPHNLESHRTVGDLIDAFGSTSPVRLAEATPLNPPLSPTGTEHGAR